MTSRSLRLWLPGVFISSTLLLALFIHARQGRPQPERSSDSSRAQQLLDKSEPVCDALATPQESLRLGAQAASSQGVVGWKVVCTNQNNEEVAQLLWKAFSGELLSVSARQPSSTTAFLTLSTPHLALAAAEHWLRVLGQKQTSGGWHLSCRRCRLGAREWWVVECVGSQCHVRLNLDASSGLLTYAMLMHAEARLPGSQPVP